MRNLTGGMHARISSACADDRDLFSRNPSYRFADLAEYSALTRLSLPSDKVGSIIFDNGLEPPTVQSTNSM